MKKFSMFLKRTLLVVLPALFAGVLSIGQLHHVSTAHADGEGSELTSNVDVESDLYRVRKTGEHSVEILFTPELKKYKNFRKSNLTELQNALTDILTDIVEVRVTELAHDEGTIDTGGVDGQVDVDPVSGDVIIDEEPEYTGQEFPDLNDAVLLINNAEDYITLGTFADLVYNYAINPESGEHELSQLHTSAILAYAHYYLRETLIRHAGNPEFNSDPKAIINDLCAMLAYRLFARYDMTPAAVYAFFCSRIAGYNPVPYTSAMPSIDEILGRIGDQGILRPDFQITLTHITGLLLLIKDNASAAEAEASETEKLGVRNLLITIGGENIKEEIVYVINNSSNAEKAQFLAQIPYRIINALQNAISYDINDLIFFMENTDIGTWMDAASQYDQLRKESDPSAVEVIKNIVNFTPGMNSDARNEIITIVTQKTKPIDVWHSIDAITIVHNQQEIQIMKNKLLDFHKILELFESLPKTSELRDAADDSNIWVQNFGVNIHTAVVGDIELEFDIGFMEGSKKNLRKIAEILDEHIHIERVVDEYTVDIDLPGMIVNMYRYFMETDILSNDLKREIWDLVFGTVEQGYEYLHGKTLAELFANKDQIDYQELAEDITCVDEIREFFGIERDIPQEKLDNFVEKVLKIIEKGTSFDLEKVYELVDKFYKLTDADKNQIQKIYDKAVKLFERIINKFHNIDDIRDYLSDGEAIQEKIDHYLENSKVQKYYSKLQRLLEKVYARIPDEYRQKSIMSYYKGNGYWAGSADKSFNLKKWIKRIPKIGSKINSILSSFFDEESLPGMVKVNLNVSSFDEYGDPFLYGINYHLSDGVKSGALPIGVDATFFANRTTALDENGVPHNIVGWYEGANDNYLFEMPARDVDAYPLYFNEFINGENVLDLDEDGYVTTYTGDAITLKVEVNNTNVSHGYSYVWYKDGDIYESGISYDPFSQIEVSSHSDSGVYCCVVDGVKTHEMKVTINKVKVTFPTADLTITWDDNDHKFYETMYKDPEHPEQGVYDAESAASLLFYAENEGVSGKEPGKYTDTLLLKDEDNYEWEENITNSKYTWEIVKKHIILEESNVLWDYVSAFTFDLDENGEAIERQVQLIDSLLPKDVEGNPLCSVEYKENNDYTSKQSAAGTYTAKVVIKPADDAHYDLVVNNKVVKSYSSELTWKINPKETAKPEGMALINDEFNYNNVTYTPELDLENHPLPEGIIGYHLVNALNEEEAVEQLLPGDYKVKAIYDVDPNYVIVGDDYDVFNWKINYRLIDITNVQWNYSSAFEFDGVTHSVELINVPSGVKVQYSGDYSAVEPGSYIAHATLTTDPTYNKFVITDKDGNQTIIDGSYAVIDLEWSIIDTGKIPTQSEFYSAETNESGKSFVWISLSGGVRGNYTLHAEKVETSEIDFDQIVETGYVEPIVCYDINFYNNKNNVVHFDTDSAGKKLTYTVRILIPNAYRDSDLVLTYVDGEGNVSRVEAETQGDYMVFTTEHLSIYGLVITHVAGSNIIPYVVTSAVVLLATQATLTWILILLAKRRRHNVKD